MKNLKIEVPKGYEIDQEKSTFENIVFKEVEQKSKYPKSVDEIKRRDWYISPWGIVVRSKSESKTINQVSSKERAEAFVALIQLVELRDEYNRIDGFVADWNNLFQDKYYMVFLNGEIKIRLCLGLQRVLYFSSEKTAETFLNNHRELIETAKELI